jgi:hypothetical protein
VAAPSSHRYSKAVRQLKDRERTLSSGIKRFREGRRIREINSSKSILKARERSQAKCAEALSRS